MKKINRRENVFGVIGIGGVVETHSAWEINILYYVENISPNDGTRSGLRGPQTVPAFGNLLCYYLNSLWSTL